jgi:hypothetical protein
VLVPHPGVGDRRVRPAIAADHAGAIERERVQRDAAQGSGALERVHLIGEVEVGLQLQLRMRDRVEGAGHALALHRIEDVVRERLDRVLRAVEQVLALRLERAQRRKTRNGLAERAQETHRVPISQKSGRSAARLGPGRSQQESGRDERRADAL